jgi:formamidopyrimidine-DNA glycosylase
MPELPEIAVLARQMNDELVGKRFAGATVLQPKCLNLPTEEFSERLAGAEIIEVTHRGKWIVAQLSNGWLLLNLGMGGEILLVTPESLPEKYRVVLDFDDGSCLAINHWWFGQVHWAAADKLDEHSMTAKLGPNALGMPLDEFKELLDGRRGGIKSFLLNQSHIAGIGNVYVQDSLFKARIHPLRSIKSLSEEEVEALWRAVQDTLQEGYDLGGSAGEMDLFGNKGRWDESFLLVGYREGLPCPNCGATIEKIKTGSTSGFICPSCQLLE